MLQDVLELRLNNWVPRRDDNNPKTIDQIHKEAAEEERKTMILIQQSKLPKREPPGKGMMISSWNLFVIYPTFTLCHPLVLVPFILINN